MQELSAIQMNAETRQIVDVYHAHARRTVPDDWAVKHIHGLSDSFLNTYGFLNEESLINDFRNWRRGKDVLAFYGNNPGKEKQLLGIRILDMCIPQWSERVHHPSHRVAQRFKQESIPVLHTVALS